MNRRSVRFNSFFALLTLPVYREGLHHICDAPKEMPVTRISRKNEMANLRFAAARPALPRVPIAKQFELLVEPGFFDQTIEFCA